MTDQVAGIERCLRAILDLEVQVIEGQRSILDQVAGAMVSTLEADGRIFVFGTGHSHLLAEEGFYRAGGLAAVVPIFSSVLMLHENPALSSRLERTGGIAGLLLEPYHPKPGEMLFIYSNSGVNTLPVEMALRGREAGLTVVAVASAKYSRVAPLSPVGKRLPDAADFFIDNGGEPGDALLPIEGSQWRVAPTSTILGALIWDCLITETMDRMQKRGLPLPVIASLNMPGAGDHNREILEKWRKVNRHL